MPVARCGIASEGQIVAMQLSRPPSRSRRRTSRMLVTSHLRTEVRDDRRPQWIQVQR
jgi:hypothetical protein